MYNALFSFRHTYITGKPFWCKSKSFFKATGLVLSSLCLDIDRCMINLSIAPGHVLPEQWKAASTADANCMPPEIIDYRRENQISHFVLQKGPSERGFRGPQKMRTSVIFCDVALGVLKSLSSLRATLSVFELCGFWGGVGKRTRRRATPSSSPRRRRSRRMG